MNDFADQLKHSLDRRLPHFSTSIPYVVATVLIMMVPLSVVLSQQETRTRSQAASSYPVSITVTNSEDGTAIADASVSIDYQPGQLCKTNTNGRCSLRVTKHEPGQVHKVYAHKQDEFYLEKKEFTINPAADATTVSIALEPVSKKENSTLPSPGSKEYMIYIVVTNSVNGKPLVGATVKIFHAPAEGQPLLGESPIDDCTTDVEGMCPLSVPDKGDYRIHADHDDFEFSSKTITVSGLGGLPTILIPLKPTKPSGTVTQPSADDTKDPNTGSPPSDSGTQMPGPEDFNCLGSCPTPTPNYCITPAPSEADSPEETDTPSPTGGLQHESFFERVQRQITETWERVFPT